ncbi:MAG TPA: glycogen debranching N-terminal domain-containing protein, partial [Caulobacteraceae bacterium]
MSLEIKVGPPELTVHQGYSVMVSDPDGQIPEVCQKGLFFLDTRLICVWTMFIDGSPWKLLNGGGLTGDTGRVFCTNPKVSTADSDIEENTLGLAFGRRLEGGMREDVEVANHATDPASFNLEFAIRSDFADLFEVKAKSVTRRGDIEVTWPAKSETLTTTYTNKNFRRAIRVRASDAGSPMTYANGRLSFKVELEPGATWRASLLYDFANGDTWSLAPKNGIDDHIGSKAMKEAKLWKEQVLKVETSNNTFAAAFAQSIDDMHSLRLPLDGTNHMKFVPAAGLPWFVALFGRDPLVISLQNTIVHPEFAEAALTVLGKWQASERDDYRDADPGKIHHELRRGELAHFKLIPHTPYYGTADATPLYLITLHSAWMATGDRSLLTKHLGTAERCLSWIDDYGDLDGDGFQEYETRSSAGLQNQGWKDSGGAVVNVDGSMVKAPKALCELQGYVFDAWVRMAQVFDALD